MKKDSKSARLIRQDASSGELELPDGSKGRLIQAGNGGTALIDGKPGLLPVRRERSGRLMLQVCRAKDGKPAQELPIEEVPRDKASA